MLLLALAHALSDFYATAFTPLVETFRSLLGLSLTGVSAIGAAVGIFGSMMQPLMGIWGDRTRRGAMAAAGLAVSAVFIGLIGLASDVVVLTLLLSAGSLGVATFHPSSAVLVVRGHARRGTAMGLYMTGGTLGLALAPWATTRIVKGLGLPWLWLLVLPGVALAVWLWAATRDEPASQPTGRTLQVAAVLAALAPLFVVFLPGGGVRAGAGPPQAAPR